MTSEKWKVSFVSQARKYQNNLPEKVLLQFRALILDLIEKGPIRGDWPNFSKLSDKYTFHCHLKKGRPTYVACWRSCNIKEIEVYYAGTHENAPY